MRQRVHRWIRLSFLALAFALAGWMTSCGGDLAYAQSCPKIHAPALAGTEQICHSAYIALYDAQLHGPRLVVYELTAAHTLGCLPRLASFHSEGDTAKPSEYEGSGWDVGHMMPAEDGSWSEDAERDTFSTANVTPQLPGLNRQQWERLEETVRAWAWEKGELTIYVGPIFGQRPKLLKDIGIPLAFFKVIREPKSGLVLAFEMPQKDIPKGDLSPWVTTVAAIEAETGIKFGFKGGGETPWPADLVGWRKAHKAACGNLPESP